MRTFTLEHYHHISFDLDGTLVHTLAEYRHTLIPPIVRKLGGSIKDLRSVDRFWFESNRDEIIENVFGVRPDDFWELFRAQDTPEQRAKHTFAYEDAERCLRELKKRGKTISIITGAPRWIAQIEIEMLNGAPYDYYVSITSSGYPQKPDPASFNHVIEKLNVHYDTSLYVGNSNEDAYFAQNAGIDFLYLERKQHEFTHRDWMIDTITSLDDLWSQSTETSAPAVTARGAGTRFTE